MAIKLFWAGSRVTVSVESCQQEWLFSTAPVQGMTHRLCTISLVSRAHVFCHFYFRKVFLQDYGCMLISPILSLSPLILIQFPVERLLLTLFMLPLDSVSASNPHPTLPVPTCFFLVFLRSFLPSSPFNHYRFWFWPPFFCFHPLFIFKVNVALFENNNGLRNNYNKFLQGWT